MSIKWTLEALKIEALKYNTRNDFVKHSSSAYHSAHQKGLLDLVCSHMPKRISMAGSNNPNFKHTDENLHEIAKKYSSRTAFSIFDSGAYQAAHDRNIIEIICAHMTDNTKRTGPDNPNFKYTDEVIKKLALKYKHPTEFKNNHPGAYRSAIQRKILNIVCAHMTTVSHLPYNFEEIMEISLKYKIREVFRKEEAGAYQAAARLGILDKVCAHMPKSRGESHMELSLLEKIKEIYPTAKKKKDYRVHIEDKPYIKRMEIDIYIPELNKGIEFDGKYWHSFDVMRSQEHKKNWTDEDIRNYDKIKDGYFLSQGIQILHISESEWVNDPKQSLDKVLYFLNKR